jgi:hypothetical protein
MARNTGPFLMVGRDGRFAGFSQDTRCHGTDRSQEGTVNKSIVSHMFRQ